MTILEDLRSGAVRLVPVHALEKAFRSVLMEWERRRERLNCSPSDKDKFVARSVAELTVSASPDLTPALVEMTEGMEREREGCAKYLKDGETPRQRMDRDFADNQLLLEMLAKERAAREALEVVLQEAKWGKGWALEQVDRAAKEAADAQASALASESRVSALQAEVERLRGLVCEIAPYIDSIVCYASTVDEHLPNRIAHEVRAVCYGPSQDELVGRRIAEQMITKIDAVIAQSSVERAWLIELKGTTPSWAIVNPRDYDEHWTTDSTRALRFARKIDAEAYIAHIGWTEAFASEHVWADGRRSGYSDRSTADYLDKRLQEARDRSPDYEKLWAEEAERAEAAQEEIETLKALICRIEPYVDAIVCYASTMGEHEPNCIAHEVRAVCHGPSQDELVGRQIAAQMLVKIDAAASPPALAARSTEAWRDLDNARLQRAIDAFYEPCEGTTIDGIRNAILAWERG